MDGRSIIDGYRNLGFSIRGFGGTKYFWDKADKLRSDFKDDEFVHFSHDHFNGDRFGTIRMKENMAFSNTDRIFQSIDGVENWFLFINSSETHHPYHLGEFDQRTKELVDYSRKFANGKSDPEKTYYYSNGGNELHDIQVRSLEYVDKNLGILLKELPKSKPIVAVVCGDHGECFGEREKWGHMINEPEVLEVPLIINPSFTP